MLRWEIHALRVRLTWHVCRTTLALYQQQNQMSNHRQSSSWECRRAGKAGLDSLNSLLVCVNLKEKVRRVPLGRLENCDVNGEDGNGRYCLLRTRACFEVGKTKYPKCRNHGSRRRNAHHSIWRCPLGLPAARGLWAEKTPSSVKGRTSRCELRGQGCSAEVRYPSWVRHLLPVKGVPELLYVTADLKRKTWGEWSGRMRDGMCVLKWMLLRWKCQVKGGLPSG